MGIPEIIGLFSGVALFLFGMALMGDGLKRLSGNRLEPILFRLTSTRLRGAVLGAGVTAVIQSSSATSVMVVGFVNAGMMKLGQAISVIIGSIFGTSITGWVICLSYIEGAGQWSSLLSTATLTGVVAVAGIVLRMFSKNQTHQHMGDIFMGFVVLMSGMSTMSGAVSPLGQQPWFLGLVSSMTHPVAGILAGAALSAVLQSASAAVGILQALSITGAITLESAFPLLLGVAVGASAPVLLSALGANTDAKRAAMVYPVGTLMGLILCASIFYIANAVFRFQILTAVMDPFSLAFVNSAVRFAMLLVLMPVTDVLETAVSLLVPGEETEPEEEDLTLRLEERFIEHPALAVEQSRAAMNVMARHARKALATAAGLLAAWNPAEYERVRKFEKEADKYEDRVGSYLVHLTGREMTPWQNREVSKFLHTLPDFERISDYAWNVAGSAQEIHEKHMEFSGGAQEELVILLSAVEEVTRLAEEAFVTGNLESAERVEPLEQVIDTICDEMKINHVTRLQKGLCTIQQGFVFNDLVIFLERVSDHCSNVAAAVIELDAGILDTHAYLGSLKKKRTPAFEQLFNEYQERFKLNGQA